MGSAIEVVLGAPAAGGGFVTRDADGRVVFVRHGLTGERVRAALTEVHATYARADVIEVLEGSPDRVGAPCPHARPGGCGGCDYQHVALPAQRRLKAELLGSQLARVPGVDASVAVEPAGDGDGLHTRTRVRYAVGPTGLLSMRAHRSHDLVAVGRCPLAVDRLAELSAVDGLLRPGDDLEVLSLGVADSPTAWVRRRGPRGHRVKKVLRAQGLTAAQTTAVRGARHRVNAGVFWQVHELAAELLVAAVLDGLALSSGDRVADLYCGAGLFTRAAAEVVGPSGSVLGVDEARAAVADANDALRELPWARAVVARVDRSTATGAAERCTHVVLDPPRSGADRGALAAVTETSSVRTVVSVACDPATFARDLSVLVADGWRIDSLRAIDLFEMTEHVETVAVLRR